MNTWKTVKTALPPPGNLSGVLFNHPGDPHDLADKEPNDPKDVAYYPA